MSDLYWPFDTSTVSEWCGSDRGGGVVHMGTDFAVPQGSELLATATGRIVRHQINANGYGLDIIRDDGILIRNWHLSAMYVATGDRVEAGQVIGLTGGGLGTEGAGYSTGPHLHWEIRDNSRFDQVGWIDCRDLSPAVFGAETPASIEQKEEEMFAKVQLDDGNAYLWNMATGESRHIDDINDWQQFDSNLRTYKFTSQPAFDSFKEKYPFKVSISVDPAKLAEAIANKVSINVDALAQAIANKLNGGATAPDITTKAEILSAIEANYPEGA